MPRPTTKFELQTAAQTQFHKLETVIESLPDDALTATFAFEDRDRCVRDVVVHLYEWHQLLLNWANANIEGDPQPFLPAPHTWKTTKVMNVELRNRHHDTALESALQMVDESHQRVLDLIDRFTNDELFTRSHFPWTGTTTLGSYCASATSSHYDWAMKKLRKHKRTFVS